MLTALLVFIFCLTAQSVWRKRRIQMCSFAAVRAICATRSSSTIPTRSQLRVRLHSATQTAKSLRVLEVLQLYPFLWCNCVGVNPSYLSLSPHNLIMKIIRLPLSVSQAFFMTVHVKSHKEARCFYFPCLLTIHFVCFVFWITRCVFV